MPMRRSLPTITALAALGFALGFNLWFSVGCGNHAPDKRDRPVVVVSIPPLAWFVERLAGDQVEIEVMIPPGASPHTYEPSVHQMKAVADADIYVKVGHPNFSFEKAWLDRMIGDRDDLTMVDSSGGISCPGGDPHVWLSPGSARITSRAISQALAEVLPDQREMLRINLEALLEEIDTIDAENRALLAPHQGGRFLVFHSAWTCFARQYGLVQVSIEEGEREPSPRGLADLIEQVRADGVHVIFVQPQFPRRAAEEVARAIGAEVAVLDPLDRDWAATMRNAAQAVARAL